MIPTALRPLVLACALAAAALAPSPLARANDVAPAAGMEPSAAERAPAVPDLRLSLPGRAAVHPESTGRSPLEQVLRDELVRLEHAAGIDSDPLLDPTLPPAPKGRPCGPGDACSASHGASGPAAGPPIATLRLADPLPLTNDLDLVPSRTRLLHVMPALSWRMARDESVAVLLGADPSVEDMLAHASSPSANDAIARAVATHPLLPPWMVFTTAGVALAAAGGGLLLNAIPGDFWAGLDRAGRTPAAHAGSAEASPDYAREARTRQRGADALFISSGSLLAVAGIESPLAGLLGYHASLGWTAHGAVLRLDAGF